MGFPFVNQKFTGRAIRDKMNGTERWRSSKIVQRCFVTVAMICLVTLRQKYAPAIKRMIEGAFQAISQNTNDTKMYKITKMGGIRPSSTWKKGRLDFLNPDLIVKRVPMMM